MIVEGYITTEPDSKGKFAALPGVIITTASNPMTAQTTSDENGRFTITVPDTETKLQFYAYGLPGGQPYKQFTIPKPLAYWNVKLAVGGPVISAGNPPATEKKKMNLWPVYAGAGLLLLLWLRKRKKKRGKK